MKPRTLFIIALGVVFVALVAYALLREVEREEVKLASSITGIVEIGQPLLASGNFDIVKTDRLVLFLVEPDTHKPVALRIVSPLVPPQTIEIGQANSEDGQPLKGPYLLIGITDKDGEIMKVTPGEVYGRSAEPIALGTERVKLELTEPFQGSLFNEAAATAQGSGGEMPAGHPPMGMGAGQPGMPPSGMGGGGQGMRIPMESTSDPALTIQGEIRVSDALKKNIATTDKLIILLFDPVQKRPVANRIIPHTFLPQHFSISVPPELGGPGKAYFLRVLTDKDGNPFGAADGEVIGRSKEPIPLGTTGLVFMLDTPYHH